MDSDDKGVLAPDFKVAVKVYELVKIKNKSAYADTLYRELKGFVSPSAIDESLKSLLYVGVLRAEWKKNNDDSWMRAFSVSNEAMEPIKNLYDYVIELKQK